MRRSGIAGVATLVLLAAGFARADETFAGPFASKHGRYLVTLATAMAPAPINRMHAWTLTLATKDGSPVETAVIEVAASVPEIGRVAPTAPRVTRAPGEGRYLIEGMKFDMAGRWRLRLVIGAGEERDEADVPVEAR